MEEVLFHIIHIVITLFTLVFVLDILKKLGEGK